MGLFLMQIHHMTSEDLGFCADEESSESLLFYSNSRSKGLDGKTGRSSFFHELSVYSILSLSQKGSGNHISAVYRH